MENNVKKEHIYMHVYIYINITESLWCTAEIDTAL